MAHHHHGAWRDTNLVNCKSLSTGGVGFGLLLANHGRPEIIREAARNIQNKWMMMLDELR